MTHPAQPVQSDAEPRTDAIIANPSGRRRSGRIRPPVRKPLAPLYLLLLGLAWFLMKLLFGLNRKIDPSLRRLKGPLIVVGNHPTYFDPLIMALCLGPRRINFVATRSAFRVPFLRLLFKPLGVIPKMQFRSDPGSVKNMIHVLRSGGVLGLYPEAQRSFDGMTQPIDQAIAKLVRKMGVPVAAVLEHGAYFAWPRWSSSGIRLGHIDSEARLILTAEEASSLSLDTISSRIAEALAYDDAAWHQRHGGVYRSSAPAQSLHFVCYRCPSCQKEKVMRSEKRALVCTACGFRQEADRAGLFAVAAWREQQMNAWRDRIRRGLAALSLPALLERVDEKLGHSEALGRGLIRLEEGRIRFHRGDAAGSVLFDQRIDGHTLFVVELGTCLEWFTDEWTYRITPDEPESVFWLTEAVRAFRELRQAGELT